MVRYRFSRLNWAPLQNPLVQACTLLYLLHSVLKRFFPTPEFFSSYLNDLLCMPLVLALAIFLQRNVVLRQVDYRLTWPQILVILVYWSVMFEGVIPQFVARYTSDWLDVGAYALGAGLFYFCGNAGQSPLIKKPA